MVFKQPTRCTKKKKNPTTRFTGFNVIEKISKMNSYGYGERKYINTVPQICCDKEILLRVQHRKIGSK